MNQNIKIFFKEFYDFNKRDFWIAIWMNVIASLSILFFEIKNELLLITIVGISIFKTINFVSASSIMPSVSSDFDRFSWKYLQSLPLSKRDLIKAMVLTNCFVVLPLAVSLICFLPQIFFFMSTNEESLSVSSYLKIVACALPVMAFISSTTLSRNILFPRTQYSKTSKHLNYLEFIRNFILGMAFIAYSILGLFFIREHLGINTFLPFKLLIQGGYFIFTSWLIFPAIILMALSAYQNTLKVWQNEKRGYVQNNWKTNRDVPLTAFAFIAVFYPFSQMDLSTPSMYSDSKLLKAIHKKDYQKMNALLRSGADINKANKYGFTPLMAAAHDGNYEAFKMLEDMGAKHEGELKLKNEKYHNGMNLFLAAIDGKNIQIINHLISKGYSVDTQNEILKYSAVHLAALNCSTEILDTLIENKANIDAKNSLGKTALHLAAEKKCAGAIALLLDSGIDPDAKDKEGKIAFDYFPKKDQNEDMAYFLQKKSRAPASK